MWYNYLSEYLFSQGYENNELCPCVFIMKLHSVFMIVAVYVDDMNIVGTLEEVEKTISHMKLEFKMKNLGKFWFCRGLTLKHCVDGILVHQSNYTKML